MNKMIKNTAVYPVGPGGAAQRRGPQRFLPAVPQRTPQGGATGGARPKQQSWSAPDLKGLRDSLAAGEERKLDNLLERMNKSLSPTKTVQKPKVPPKPKSSWKEGLISSALDGALGSVTKGAGGSSKGVTTRSGNSTTRSGNIWKRW